MWGVNSFQFEELRGGCVSKLSVCVNLLGIFSLLVWGVYSFQLNEPRGCMREQVEHVCVNLLGIFSGYSVGGYSFQLSELRGCMMCEYVEHVRV